MNEQQIKRSIELEFQSRGEEASLRALTSVYSAVQAIIKANPQWQASSVQTTRAIQDGVTSYLNQLKQVPRAQEKIAQSAKSMGAKISQTYEKIYFDVLKLMRPLTDLAAFVGEGMGFAEGLRTAMAFDKQMLNLTVSFRKWGSGTKEVQQAVTSLSKSLGVTKTETAMLIAQYEKGFNLASLENATKLLSNIRNVVGSDADAIRGMSQELSAFTQQFPDLEQALTTLGEGDKTRLENQTRLMVMTGKISMAQYKSMQDYIQGNKKVSLEEEEAQRKLQATQKAYSELKATFQDIAITIGHEVAPAFKALSNFINENADIARKALVGLSALGLAYAAFRTASVVKSGVSGLMGTISKGASFFSGGKGKLGAAAGAVESLTGGLAGTLGGESFGSVQKVFVVGGRIHIAGKSGGGGDVLQSAMDMFNQFGGGKGKGKALGKVAAVEEEVVEVAGALEKEAATVGKLGKLGKVGGMLGKFLKPLPLLGAIAGLAETGTSLMHKDKEGNRDWTGAGLGAAAVGTAFIPVVGPLISAGITAFSLVRDQVKKNQLDTSYKATNIRTPADQDEAQRQLRSALLDMGDQFNTNRTKEESFWNKMGNWINKNTAVLATISPALLLLGGNGKTTEDDRKAYLAAREDAINNFKSQYKTQFKATDEQTNAAAMQYAIGSENLRHEAKLKEIDQQQADWWSKGWRAVVNYGTAPGLISKMMGKNLVASGAEANAASQEAQRKAEQSNYDINLAATLGKRPEQLTDADRKGLKAGESMAVEMNPGDLRALQDSLSAGATAAVEKGSVGAIEAQFRQMSDIGRTMRNKKVNDYVTGTSVAIDDTTYANQREQLTREEEARKKLAESGQDKSEEGKKKAAELDAVIEARTKTITEMDKNRVQYKQQQAAIDNVLVQRTVMLQDRIKASNELYQAQVQALTNISELMQSNGANTAQTYSAVNESLNTALGTLQRQLDSQEKLNNLIVAQEKASQEANAAESARLKEKAGSEVDPTKRQDLQRQALDLDTKVAASQDKVNALVTQMQQAPIKARLDAAKMIASALGEAQRIRIGRIETTSVATGARAELAAMGGNVGAAVAGRTAQTQQAAQMATLAREEQNAVNQGRARLQNEKAALETALQTTTNEADRKKIQDEIEGKQVAITELENKSQQLTTEIVAHVKQELEARKAAATANQQQLDLEQARVGRMEAELALLDSIGMGLNASVSQRMAVVEQMDKVIDQQKEQEAGYDKQIAQLNSEIAKMEQQGAAADQIQEKQAQLLPLMQQREQAETNILNTQMKQAQMTKSIRDGYLSAIMAMTAGSGMITKIMIDQNKNMGIAIKNMGAVSSMGVGGYGKGTGSGIRESSRFTTGGGVAGPSEEQRQAEMYDTYNQGGRYASDIRRRNEEARRRVQEAAQHGRKMESQAFEAGRGRSSGALLEENTEGRGTGKSGKQAAVNINGVTIKLDISEIDRLSTMIQEKVKEALTQVFNNGLTTGTGRR